MSLGQLVCFVFVFSNQRSIFHGWMVLANLGERPHRQIASALFEFVATLDAAEKRNSGRNFVKPLISSVRRAHDSAQVSEKESLKL
jgi:hypothetical protein